MKSEFEIAITQLCSDRNLSPQVILEAIQSALVTAYKKNYGANQNIDVKIDPRTGQAHVFVKKVVVERVEDERKEISLAEARTYKPNAALNDVIDIEIKPRNFGRIAAQTAKQVIMQRIRDAERDSVYLEYADRAGEIVNGIVRNIDTNTGNVTLSLGKAEALLPKSEQIPGEHYRFNQRLRVYIAEVERSGHGPQITASRTHRGLLRRLLEMEVPEIFSGTVEIKAVAREPGSRSKVAVAALQPGVDPVGSCVGMRGVRIQNIVNELNGEKIDVVAWSANPEVFIANALSPAKVVSVHLNEADKVARVVVPDKALSLAIGKEGQNARLAAKLTGWRIDIKSESEAAQEAEKLAAEAQEAAQRLKEQEAARKAAAELLAMAEASLQEEEFVAEGATLEAEAEAEVPAVEEASVEKAPEGVVAAVEQPIVEEAASQPEALPQEVSEPETWLETAVPEATEKEPAPAEAAISERGTLDVAELEEEPEEEYEYEGRAEGKKPRSKKDRKRTLQYDERLGRVVVRRKRKPSRAGVFEPDDDWDE